MKLNHLLDFFKKTGQTNLNLFGEDISIFFWSYNVKTATLFVTPGVERIYGDSAENMMGPDLWLERVHPDHQDILTKLKRTFAAHEAFDFKFKVQRNDGEVVWVRMKGKPVFSAEGEPLQLNGFTMDISSEKKTEEDLRESVMKYQTLIDKSAHAVYIAQDGVLVFVNAQFEEMMGYSEKELIGMSYYELLDEESAEIALMRFLQSMHGKSVGTQELRLVRKDGSKIIAELRSASIEYKGAPAMMGTILDVTEKKLALASAEKLAFYDDLTGLPNRNHFYDEVSRYWNRPKGQPAKFALLFIDLDQLKRVNDAYGHHVGDAVIRDAGRELQKILEPAGFIARYGGDEFVALVECDSRREAEELAEEVIRRVPAALPNDLSVTPTVGMSFCPDHGKEVETLLKYADVAMYYSKRDENRKISHCTYSEELNDKTVMENRLVSDMQKALKNQEFRLMYQPKIDLKTREVTGAEALLRWHHPAYGFVSPLDFIPLAEKTGHIHRIGEWVLKQAMADIQSIGTPIMLNVNISSRQLLSDHFFVNLTALLDETGYPPERLNLEITESVVLYDIDRTMDVLEQLRKLGVCVSLDDFGTGYSSLSYLTKLAVDYLKIDRSFILDMEENESKALITKSIIDVAHSLKMKVVAEGIETAGQEKILRGMSCDFGQGYLFSRPLPLEDFKAHLKEVKPVS
ncbi:sensor domain-containing protein [Indiicoccus explosivorum]|uniref:sensor domain-containing protein n=1 Tax=Indiicoccus explosivorum TaxID=1917864 RepID=UPI00138FA110|nr:GGDEF domain-containing phosphodiesterase [Indiicoccus explosivorum]